jgi:hypothetical protein
MNQRERGATDPSDHVSAGDRAGVDDGSSVMFALGVSQGS